jgi:hypothetical protein
MKSITTAALLPPPLRQLSSQKQQQQAVTHWRQGWMVAQVQLPVQGMSGW